MKKYKKRIFEIIQIGNRGDQASRIFDYFIVAVIGVNIAVLFLETFDALLPYMDLLEVIEGITIAIFIVEYILRLWTSDLLYPGYSKPRAMLRFATSFEGIVDLLTILPFFFLSGFVALRILRVVRIFRLFQINASYDSFNVIATVFKKKKNQIASSVFIILMLMMVSSLCIYSAEHEAQPEVYRNAFSGIWWSLSTIFTVGYGDIYPVTTLGRIMTVVVTFLGVGAVAIPTGIISAGFVEQYTEISRARRRKADPKHAICETVGESSPYIGLAIKEVEKTQDYHILAIVRNGEVLMPGSTTKIDIGDTLIGSRS